jgi:hypothetical protein
MLIIFPTIFGPVSIRWREYVHQLVGFLHHISKVRSEQVSSFSLHVSDSRQSTVVLENGLTDTLFVTLFWPHRQGLSADQLLSGPHQIDGHRKRHSVWYCILACKLRDAYEI